MKPTTYSLFILAIPVLLSGCTTTSAVRPYTEQSASGEIQKGVIFSLPTTILEATITYSLYEKKIWAADPHGNPKKADKEGKLLAPKTTSKVVVVDKPIQVITKTISDPSMRFIFDVDSLSGLTKSTDITLELTSNGLIKSSNIVVQDKTKEIIANTTGTLVNLAKIAAVAGTDVVELVLLKDVTVTRIIDPSELTYTVSSGKSSATYKDLDKAKAIFDASLKVPEISIRFKGERNISDKIPVKPDLITGIPYRAASPLRVSVSVDDREIYDQFHMFAQAGAVAYMPVSARAFSDLTQGITFSEDGAYLAKFSSKGTSVGESVSSAAKDTTNAIFSGIKDVEQTKIDKLKKERELLDAKKTLSDQESLADTQAKIDRIKKEKELIDAELALAESKKKQAESQSK